MPSDLRSGLGEMLAEVLAEQEADSGNSSKQAVHAIGLEALAAPTFVSKVGIMDAKLSGRQKRRLEELARELRASKRATESLRATGRWAVDLRQADVALDGLPLVRHFYAHRVTLAWPAGSDPTPLELHAWAFTSKRSSTPFGPLLLRESLDRLVGTAIATLHPPSRETFAHAMRAGAMRSALAILAHLYDLDAVVLWHYDETRRRYRSLASHGTGDHPFSVPVGGRAGSERKGVVAQVRPDRRAVVYDAQDPSLWRPRGADSWEPFDLDLFKARRWRSCMAIPIVCSGRLIGALSVYTHRSAVSLNELEQHLTDDAFNCASTILTRREQQVIASLAGRYDEELLSANVSISALSLSHDVLHYYRSVLKRVTDSKGYLETDQSALALETVTQAALTMERTEPALKAMRKLANEARTHESTKGPQQTDNAAEMLGELRPLLRSILPLFSKSKRLSPENVHLATEGEVRPVLVTPFAFERLVVNLCVNAAQWNASNVWVTGHFDRSSDDFQLVVRDDGRGIPPSARDRVFDRFYSSRGGSGLGLYVVKSIAVSAGGDVHLQSYHRSDRAEQRGTAVTVMLPTK